MLIIRWEQMAVFEAMAETSNVRATMSLLREHFPSILSFTTDAELEDFVIRSRHNARRQGLAREDDLRFFAWMGFAD